MEAFALAMITTAAALWSGAIVFQSAVVAPVVFVNLDETNARVFLRTLFPRLFRLGLVCGGVMIAGLLWLSLGTGWTSALGMIAAATIVMLVCGTVSLWMVPHINNARDAGPFGAARFRRLHRANVALTLLILALGIAVLCLIANRAASVL